jgi:glycosyltransferase involved in cell wall biosynthesis
MISIICATKNRPENIARLIKSARDTATDFEFVFVIDEGDSIDPQGYTVVINKDGFISLGALFNKGVPYSKGDIYMLCGDDVVFNSKDWDIIVQNKINSFTDKLCLVYGNDLLQGERMATHPFIHKRWVEILGYLNPPQFFADFGDVYLMDIARGIGRLIYLPEVITEHRHFANKKAVKDSTYSNREKYKKESRVIYDEMKDLIKGEIEKLKSNIVAL